MIYIFLHKKEKAWKVSGLALNSNKCTWAQSVSFPRKNEGLVPDRFLFIAWCTADHHAARSFPAASPRVIASSHFTQPPKYYGMELCHSEEVKTVPTHVLGKSKWVISYPRASSLLGSLIRKTVQFFNAVVSTFKLL